MRHQPQKFRGLEFRDSYYGKYLCVEQMRDEPVSTYFHEVNSHVYSKTYGQSLDLINLHQFSQKGDPANKNFTLTRLVLEFSSDRAWKYQAVAF